MTVRFAARADWPHPVTPAQLRRSRWTFKASLADTQELLRAELAQLGADDALVEAAVRPQDVIRNGGAFSSRTPLPSHPGVTVTVRTETGVRVFATDVCELWEHNLRSIALGLGALRAVSRYGITPRGEQYAGFRAIASGTTVSMRQRREEAAQTLVLLADLPIDAAEEMKNDPAARRSAYRRAAAATHPDRGHDPEAFTRLQDAMRVLDGPR